MRAVFKVVGMTCVNCAKAIEINLRRLKGIEDVKVSFELGRLDVTFNEKLLDTQDIKKVVESLGYKVIEGKQEKSKEVYILISCILASILLMILMFVRETWSIYVQLVLSSLVQVIGGYRFYKSALHSLRSGIGNMDVLIALGSTSAYLYSFLALIGALPGQPFFETSALLITFVRLGKFIEESIKDKALGMLKGLFLLQTGKVKVLKENKEEEKQIMNLFKGETIVLKTGDVVPVDCKILEGNLELDESLITGESLPVIKRAGDQILSGSMVVSGFAKAKVEKTFSGSYVSAVISMIDTALKEKPSIQRIADRFSHYFVQFVVGLAVLVFIFWYLTTYDLQKSVNFALSVLVVSCPCAFGIAVPLAVAVSLTKAYKKGIIVKNPVALEKLLQVNLVLIDKTGTLTEGKPKVIDTKIYSEEALSIAHALASKSNHPYSKAIKEYCEKFATLRTLEFSGCKEVAGVGVMCEDYLLGRSKEGNPALMQKDKVLVEFIIEDRIRKESYQVISFLKNKNIKLVMLTGDSLKKASHVARALNIEEFIAEVKPEDKLDIVKHYQEKGYKVCMIGDGINDAPAMAQAHVSIAMSEGTDIAKKVGDIVLPNIGLLRDAFITAEKSIKRIKQNIFWAFLYNTISIPVAAGVLLSYGLSLTPELAGLMMVLSSLSVVINSVRK